MCAIIGMLQGNGRVDQRAFVSMRDTMIHRGPDDAGTFLSKDGKVAFGHRRLSIIDLSANGHQPMCNEDGTVWLVFNGEIYNFQALRGDLIKAGHVFRSNTDTEVIIHAYEEWGTQSIQRLRGMFSFAIWDEKRSQCLLVRDRLGIKPLFYWEQDGNLTFASELKGVMADKKVKLTLDETAIYDFLTYLYIPTPKTIYRDIKKLPPGHYALFKDGKFTVTQYWDPPFIGDRTIDEIEAVTMLRSKLQETMELHMIADVPVGVMLSGGLDSSSISAFAAGITSKPIHTFSIGFDVKEHDETHFARMVVDRYGTEHHELILTKEMAMSLRKPIVALYDEPFADSSAIPTLCVSQLARRNVTVALSGEGGDELFGGYNWYSTALRIGQGDFLPTPLRRALRYPSRLLPAGLKGKWTLHMASLDPVERYAKLLGASLRSEKQFQLSPKFFRQFSGYDDYWYFRKFWRPDLDPFSRLQYLDMKTYLNDDILTKVDRASMAVSLEARVPLLDHELIETVLSLPRTVRNRNCQKKYLLKMAVSDYLPGELITRKKKGFSIPLYEWLKEPEAEELGPFHDGMFNVDSIVKRKIVRGSDLWPVIVMNNWLCNNA